MQTEQNNLPVSTSAPVLQTDSFAKTFHPLGALLLHSLPQLFLICLWGWMLISYQSSLEETAKPFFYLSFSILLLGWLINLGTILYHFLAGITLSLSWISISLVAYLVMLVLYYLNLDQYDTLGVPAWQQPEEILYYTGSFLLPAILHLLTLLALQFSHRSSSRRTWGTALLALVPPIICYLLIMGAFSLRLPVELDTYWLVLLVAIATVSSIFLLILGGVRVARASAGWARPAIGLKLLLTAIAPLGCLLFNNGVFESGLLGSSGIFGDFNHPVFYVLALINGLLISMPVEILHLRRWAFLGRCMLLPFSLYFFFVMAPFMPLSIFLSFFFGLGLLLLVPVGVLGFHLQALLADIRSLQDHYPVAKLALAGAFALLVLPAGIYLNYQHDRVVLHQALDYLEDPSATGANVSVFSLRRSLDHIEGNKERNLGWFDGRNTPLLTPWFTWQVLDGLSLSDKKVSEIKKIFLNEPLRNNDREFSGWVRPADGAVTLTSLSGSSTYRAELGYWESQIELEMHNPSTWWEEYSTQFRLPPGSWVSDYYLYLGKVKEPGLLVERKSALWVYDQITSTRKDPGLLRYLPNGELELRVFPFTGKQSRKTGFALIHKRPFTLRLDGQELPLGEESDILHSEPAITPSGAYIPAELKAELPQTIRKGYWHIILDCSEGKERQLAQYKKNIEQLMREQPALAQGAKISFVGHSVQTYPLELIALEAQWEQQKFAGGFYLERAFQQLLLNHYKRSTSDFPVPVVISDRFDDVLLPATFLDISFALPPHGLYYRMGTDGKLNPYSMAYPHQASETETKIPQIYTALVWPKTSKPQFYLADDGNDTILPFPTASKEVPAIAENAWYQGLELWTRAQRAHLYPDKNEWVAQIKASFSARVLSPHTAFMVVEEAWQRDMLLKKQEQYLNGHPGLDSDTELDEMPEPEFWLMLALLGGWLWWQKRKKIKLLASRS